MSLTSKLRVFLVCVALEAGVFSGVPMRPGEIQDLLQQMNQAVLAHVLPAEGEGGDDNGGSPDISGEWDVHGSFDPPSVARGMPPHADLVCTFERHAERLQGTCRPSDGPAGVPVEGQVDGRNVEWHFNMATEPGGKKQTVTFVGVVNDADTSMKGTLAIGEMRGEFTAEKQSRGYLPGSVNATYSPE